MGPIPIPIPGGQFTGVRVMDEIDIPMTVGKFTGVRFMEETGICYDSSGKKDRCALHREDCLIDEVYKSYIEALQVDDDGGCDPNDIHVGRCLDQVDGTGCAVRITDCIDTAPDKFSEPDASCTLQRDKSKEWDANFPEFTQFGSCMFDSNGSDEYFCVYSPVDCDSINDYMTPVQTKAVGKICDCSSVHVSGCVAGDGSVYCGVDKNACGRNDQVISPMEQRFQRLSDPNNLDCRLCNRVNTATPTRSPTRTPTRSPTRSPMTASPMLAPIPLTFAPTSSSTDVSTGMKNTGMKNEDGENGVVIGAIIAGVLVVLIAFILLYRFLSRERMKERGVEQFTPPMNMNIT